MLLCYCNFVAGSLGWAQVNASECPIARSLLVSFAWNKPNPRNGYKKGGKFYLNRESFPLVTLEWNQPDLNLCYFLLLYFEKTNVVSCFSCALSFYRSPFFIFNSNCGTRPPFTGKTSIGLGSSAGKYEMFIC